MLTETVKNLLAERKAEKNRVSICTKAHEAFVMERHNEKAQLAARHANFVAHIKKLNKVVNDPTFKFVVWDYGNFYSVQVFEGEENSKEMIVVGEVNTNWADENNLYIQRPMTRKRFRTLKGVESYIVWYYTFNIKMQNDCLAKRGELDSVQAVYEINTVEVHEAKFRESRAVVFDVAMMVFWQKHKLLPKIKQLYNGKRYNRTVHAKKVIAALEQGKIVKQDQHYIVYWTL